MNAVVVQSEQELDTCLGIRREVFIIEQEVPEDLEIDELDHLESAATHVLLYDNEQAVATARLKPYNDDAAKVQRVAVLRQCRGKGYGDAMMQVLEKLARSQNYREVVLDAQCHAAGFYEKLGYEIISDKFMDAGIEHVRMKNALPQ